MKKILKIILPLLLIISFIAPFFVNTTFAVNENLNIGGIKSEGSHVKNNEALKNIKTFLDWKVRKGGEKGITNTLFRIAKDLKNVFFALAGIFYLVAVFKILFSSNSEEEFGKFKKAIIWITVGIIIMQISYGFVKILFDRGVGEALAFNLVKDMILPLVEVLQTGASFFFIAVAIFAFYSIITANGGEEKTKKGKMSIIYAIAGFIVIKFAKIIVEAVYGKIDCKTTDVGLIQYNSGQCVNPANISDIAGIIVNIINWANGLVGIIVVIMIIYTGAQVLLSAGDEKKLKKAKTSIIYIAIGVAILITNYLILTFFIIPETVI